MKKMILGTSDNNSSTVIGPSKPAYYFVDYRIWSLETSRDILHYKMLDKRIFISAKAKDGRSKRINVVTLA